MSASEAQRAPLHASASAEAQSLAAAAPERDFRELARDLENLEAIIEGWESQKAGTAQALKTTVEEILLGAIKRLIKSVKESPGGLDALRASLEDEWVRTVLQVHGILRAPDPNTPEQKVLAALESVRPMLASHDGDVELLAVRNDEVEVKLLGSCDGCSQSSVTVKLGIETAIREALPRIERVVVREGKAASTAKPAGEQLIGPGDLLRKVESPFAGQWEDAGPAEAVPVGAVIAVELSQASVLLTQLSGGQLRAYPNACTHLGMPLDTGTIEPGDEGPEIVCRYHGFRYRLEDGECVTAPEVALPRYGVRVEKGRVLVRASAAAGADR